MPLAALSSGRNEMDFAPLLKRVAHLKKNILKKNDKEHERILMIILFSTVRNQSRISDMVLLFQLKPPKHLT